MVGIVGPSFSSHILTIYTQYRSRYELSLQDPRITQKALYCTDTLYNLKGKIILCPRNKKTKPPIKQVRFKQKKRFVGSRDSWRCSTYRDVGVFEYSKVLDTLSVRSQFRTLMLKCIHDWTIYNCLSRMKHETTLR